MKKKQHFCVMFVRIAAFYSIWSVFFKVLSQKKNYGKIDKKRFLGPFFAKKSWNFFWDGTLQPSSQNHFRDCNFFVKYIIVFVINLIIRINNFYCTSYIINTFYCISILNRNLIPAIMLHFQMSRDRLLTFLLH